MNIFFMAFAFAMAVWCFITESYGLMCVNIFTFLFCLFCEYSNRSKF